MLDSDNLNLSDGSEIPLGLILSKEIVKQYGGQLDFTSEYTVGSTFVFSFGVELPNDNLFERQADTFRGESPRFAPDDKQEKGMTSLIFNGMEQQNLMETQRYPIEASTERMFIEEVD